MVLGSAIVPVQIIITILLLRSSSGKITAVAFVLLCSAAMLAVIAVAVLAPTRSEALLTSVSDWLEAHNRMIVTVLAWSSEPGSSSRDWAASA